MKLLLYGFSSIMMMRENPEQDSDYYAGPRTKLVCSKCGEKEQERSWCACLGRWRRIFSDDGAAQLHVSILQVMYLHGAVAASEDDSFTFGIDIDGGDDFREVVGGGLNDTQVGVINDIYAREIAGDNGAGIVGKRLVPVNIAGLRASIDARGFGDFFTRCGMADGQVADLVARDELLSVKDEQP